MSKINPNNVIFRYRRIFPDNDGIYDGDLTFYRGDTSHYRKMTILDDELDELINGASSSMHQWIVNNQRTIVKQLEEDNFPNIPVINGNIEEIPPIKRKKRFFLLMNLIMP